MHGSKGSFRSNCWDDFSEFSVRFSKIKDLGDYLKFGVGLTEGENKSTTDIDFIKISNLE